MGSRRLHGSERTPVAQLEEVARAGQFELGQRAQEQLFIRGVYEMIERTELGEELPPVGLGAQIGGVPLRAGQLRQRFAHPHLAARHDDDTRWPDQRNRFGNALHRHYSNNAHPYGLIRYPFGTEPALPVR